MIIIQRNREWTDADVERNASYLMMILWAQGETELGEWVYNAWTDEMIMEWMDAQQDEMAATNLKYHIEELARIIHEI